MEDGKRTIYIRNVSNYPLPVVFLAPAFHGSGVITFPSFF